MPPTTVIIGAILSATPRGYADRLAVAPASQIRSDAAIQSAGGALPVQIRGSTRRLGRVADRRPRCAGDPRRRARHSSPGAAPPVASERVLATVMFTDIVGSTELAGAARRRALEGAAAPARRRRCASEVAKHRGRVVKSLGDGALALFDGPSRAIGCARRRQRAACVALGLRVRAGLHTGECELLPGEDVGGIAVHIAARIAALAERRRGARERHGPRPLGRLAVHAREPRRAAAQGRRGALAASPSGWRGRRRET